jgi:hypothetical protein
MHREIELLHSLRQAKGVKGSCPESSGPSATPVHRPWLKPLRTAFPRA